MSEKLLGKSFDIHGGGQDLIFPHHENEIAQSTSVHGRDAFAKYWMHNGYLMAEGKKMSKSLGNFYTVHDLLKEYPGEAIRLVLLKTHYRQPLDFTKEGILEAKRELDGFYGALRRALDIKAVKARDLNVRLKGYQEALCDDLNTPLALSHLHARMNQLNLVLGDDSRGGKISQSENKWLLLEMGKWLGLLQDDPEDWFKRPRIIETEVAAASTDPIFGIIRILSDEEIDAKKTERTAARKNRDFKRADEIRKELDAQGIVLEDLPDGTTEWRRK